MIPSPAFLHEVRHQMSLARQSLAAARHSGDDAASESAAGRLVDLVELTDRSIEGPPPQVS